LKYSLRAAARVC